MLKVLIDVDERILDAGILKLTLQPLVENAVMHGFKDKKEECLLEITGRIEEKNAVVCVNDNGSGIPAKTMETILSESSVRESGEGGLGLVNVHQRLKLKYGEEYGLALRSVEGQGTEMEVRLPFKGGEYV